ncbi:MAG: SAF domain-containing protein, partial [Thermoplasmata archaeon]
MGGFLVSLAAVGIFAAYTEATTSHRVQFVVANQDLAIGQRITVRDLAVEPMELPNGLADTEAFRNTRTLVGAVVVGPVRAG